MKAASIFIIIVTTIILSGCLEELNPDSLYVRSYPISYIEGVLELNYTEVMNINNTTFHEEKFKELNYSTYKIIISINNTTSVNNIRVSLQRNSTEFKYGGYLDIYIVKRKTTHHTQVTKLD